MSQSNVTLNCLGWMQNQVGQSPCATAQAVGQLCQSGYTVSVNNFQETDYVPDATTANSCTCSWSIYNLLSACTFCVGKYQYPSWSVWISQCGSHVSNTTYLSSKHTLSQGIPYWAATNPSTWINSTFNATQAADIAATPHQDVTGAPLQKSSTSTETDSPPSRLPVGAIIGGATGVAILLIGGLIVFCAARRRRRRGTRPMPAGGPFSNLSRPDTPVPAFSNWTPTTPMPLPPEPTYGRPSSLFLTPPRLSTTTRTLNSPLASPISSGIYMNEHDPFANMNSPYFATPPKHQISRANSLLPPSPTTEFHPDPKVSFSEACSRLNPPPYAEAVPDDAIPLTQMASMEKREKWNDTVIMAPSEEQLEVSTPESVTAILPSPGMKRNPTHAVWNR